MFRAETTTYIPVNAQKSILHWEKKKKKKKKRVQSETCQELVFEPGLTWMGGVRITPWYDTTIQNSMEAILACHPALSTEWLDWVATSCGLWRMHTGPIALRDTVIDLPWRTSAGFACQPWSHHVISRTLWWSTRKQKWTRAQLRRSSQNDFHKQTLWDKSEAALPWRSKTNHANEKCANVTSSTEANKYTLIALDNNFT